MTLPANAGLGWVAARLPARSPAGAGSKKSPAPRPGLPPSGHASPNHAPMSTANARVSVP